MKVKSLLACLGIAGLLGAFTGSYVAAETYPWMESGLYDPAQTIKARIPAPDGFKRTDAASGGLAEWLRGLPLRPEGSPVRLYPVSEGRVKAASGIHKAVVDLEVLRFQECADAAIRLWAEYLWSAGKADSICFRFTSGDDCCWVKWKQGWRPEVRGRKVEWRKSGVGDAGRKAFMAYLDKVMEYAGSASLAKELPKISASQLDIGDAIIQGGSPGHAVLLLDMAENDKGERIMLLGQSYMPAQEFHVLNNPGSTSPWYPVKAEGLLITPEWTFDMEKDCRRFTTAMTGGIEEKTGNPSDSGVSPIMRANARLKELEAEAKGGWGERIERQIDSLAKDNKKDPVVLHAIGTWCARQGNHEKAFDVLCQAALAARIKGLADRRDEDLERVIETDRAASFGAINNSKQIVPLLEAIQSRNPFYLPLEGYSHLAGHYHSTGQPEKEIEVLMRAAEPFFEVAEIHLNLARLLFERGDLRQAIIEFQWASNVNPVHPHLKEMSFEMFRVMDSASSRCRNDPAFEASNSELCTFLSGYERMTSGPVAAAVENFKRCSEQNPAEPLYRLYLGGFYLKGGDYESAVRELREFTTHPYVRSFYRAELELGETYYRRGWHGRAKTHWEHARAWTMVPWVRAQAEKRLKAIGSL